jgi:outer membrane lipoprotein-sorting protein
LGAARAYHGKKATAVKKALCAILLPLFLASFAAAQTVVEAAKKEKERREDIKAKASVVVTNADLTKTKKKASTTAPFSVPPAEGEIAGKAVVVAATANADAEAQRQAEIAKRYLEMKAELEDKAAKTKERTELLDLKLKSLQQRFFTFNSMQSKDQVQQEIAQTYQTLQAAAAEQVKAKDDLEKFLALAARDKAAAVGIRQP